MQRPTPAWIRAVLVSLLLLTLRERIPAPMPAEARATLAALRVERDPRAMCLRELRQLPGVGQTLAQAVARARDEHRAPWPLFWEHVSGIGPVRARRIRAWLRAHGVAPDPLAWAAPISARSAPGLPHAAPSGADGSLDGYPLGMDRLSFPVVLALAPFLATCREASEGTRPAAGPRALGSPVHEPPTPVQSRALLDGALHALEAGPAHGPAVLLLHGGRYSARDWQELGTLEELARAGYHALALDWPGHGATPAWSQAPEASLLLARVCDELALERVSVVGASLGGGFALEFSRAVPGRVAGLVAIAPAGSASFAPEGWRTPTLLLWGGEDEILAPEVGQALQQRLAGARLEVLPGTGHACYLQQPERFHALLLEFLSAL